MRLATVIALAAALAVAIVLPAAAQKGSGNAAFDTLDKNQDRKLSREEVKGDKEVAKRFAKFDANKDGSLNVDEFMKANKDNDARVVNDSSITTKVKAALLGEKGIPSMSISVETYEAQVQLSGTVDTDAIKASAGKVASGVSGVKKVQNDLKVK